MRRRHLLQARPQAAVRGDAPRRHQHAAGRAVPPEHGGGIGRAVGERVGGGGLERGGEVRNVLFAGRGQRLGGAAQRGLEAGEGEAGAGPSGERARQAEPRRIARLRRLLDRRPAGKAQPEQAGGLVERLAERVVLGLAVELVAADAFHRQ